MKNEENNTNPDKEKVIIIENKDEKKDEFIRKNVSTKYSFNSIKTGISFGFTWYRNKIYPWADWNISCMFSLGLQFFYNRNFDFGFYKWGIFICETEYDFHNQNNPNTRFNRKKIQEGDSWFPIYGLFQISAGFNKFSIWFRIYYSPITRKKDNFPPIYPYEHLNKTYYDNNQDVKIEYKEKQAEDCNNRELDSGEYYRCCFIEAEMKGVESKTCLPLSKEEYDDIGDYIDKSEKAAKDMGVDVEDYSIDCGSNYIVISILSLILLFI